ncbi:hypothetical protein BJ912DRAFT_961710 [Pholiota molesta]|nr:hypothetical protein BJ912DRAFT_961710 [Pholiota molesta]
MPSSSSSLRRTVPSSPTRLSRLISILIGLTTLYAPTIPIEIDGLWSRTSFARTLLNRVHVQAGQTDEEQPRNAIIEAHMNGLAQALGIPVHELASAIANVVRGGAPPASLSSPAVTEAGEIVEPSPRDEILKQ